MELHNNYYYPIKCRHKLGKDKSVHNKCLSEIENVDTCGFNLAIIFSLLLFAFAMLLL